MRAGLSLERTVRVLPSKLYLTTMSDSSVASSDDAHPSHPLLRAGYYLLEYPDKSLIMLRDNYSKLARAGARARGARRLPPCRSSQWTPFSSERTRSRGRIARRVRRTPVVALPRPRRATTWRPHHPTRPSSMRNRHPLSFASPGRCAIVPTPLPRACSPRLPRRRRRCHAPT